MAIVTFLFSFVLRKLNNIGQAVFGWSITALFGKLERRSQVLVTGALLISLAWPLFVLGVFVPSAATWAVAFVPYHHVVGATGVRILWVTLAVVAPIVVGILVHVAAPAKKGSIVRTAVNGYPLAIGFFCAFVVVVITVPIIKASSVIRRWSDEHVYVEAHAGAYDGVFRALAEACARANLMPEVTDAPRHMVLATNIMRTCARGAVSAIVTEDLRRIRCDGVQMYLYPADLLLRGEPTKVARVRAMMSRTMLDADAYLVASADAKHIQDELAAMTHEFLDASERGDVQAAPFATRLRALYHRMLAIDVDYPEWTMLEAMARRFERRLVAAGAGPDAGAAWLPIDQEADGLPKIAAAANGAYMRPPVHATA